MALAAFGLMRDEHPQHHEESFRVYAFNWPVLTAFWATWHQWRFVVINGQGVREGMDWQQVESALNLAGVKRAQRAYIYNGLRAIQEVVLDYFNGDQ